MALPRRTPAPDRPDALDWRHRAVCRDTDPEIFFPVAQSGPVLSRAEARALAWCAVCPVRAQCLAFALEHLPDGVAGGTTAHQRHALRRRRAAAPGDPGSRPGGPGPLRAPTIEVRTEGIELLIKGVPRSAVAGRCRVSRRTVDRWAARPECVAAGVVPAQPERSPLLTREQARRCGSRRVS